MDPNAMLEQTSEPFSAWRNSETYEEGSLSKDSRAL
jgi:hypothetical protein